MRYLTLSEVLGLQQMVITQSGGAPGVRNLGGVDSAVAQPQMGFGGQEFYATLAEKAAALAFSLVMNHPFVDGNKRIGHAAMETFLVLNGHELRAPVGEQEQVILQLAASTLGRDEFTDWVRAHLVEMKSA
ncbi:MAG: type II toxin-antitoxin system death-on-curing family toxin [Gemmataceae bacterium]|nr:type II toxin-antitoxin system death-on-curing family toxin [Gemmataceae bacterium]